MTAWVRRALGAGIVGLLAWSAALGVPGASSAATDSDDDGLPNKFERDPLAHEPASQGHRPRRDRATPTRTPTATACGTATSTSPARTRRKKDTDGDGAKDGAEDPDGDGLSNVREQAAAHLPAQGRLGRRRDARRPRGSRRRRPVEHHRVPRRHRPARRRHRRRRAPRRDRGHPRRRAGEPASSSRSGRTPASRTPTATASPTVRRTRRRRADDAGGGRARPRPAGRRLGRRRDASTATSRGRVDAPVIQGAPDCTVFPADNVWNVPRRRARRSPRTAPR